MATLFTALALREVTPSVAVHPWMEPRTIASVKVEDSFELFDTCVRRAVRAGPADRFYWFPADSGGRLEARRQLKAESYAEFSAYARSTWDAALWVWTGGPASPDQPPVSAPASEPAPPPTPVPYVPAPSTTSGRSASVQAEFRVAVLMRDGHACVLCRRTWADTELQSLEAAHVVAHGSSTAVLAEAGLFSPDEVRNGIALCATPCHFWYDKLHWWVDATSGLVCATEALLSDARFSPHFAPLVNNPLRTAPRAWPEPATWAVQQRLCMERTNARRAEAEKKPYTCPKCGKRCASQPGLERHATSCRESVAPRQLFTPGTALGDIDDDGDSGAGSGGGGSSAS